MLAAGCGAGSQKFPVVVAHPSVRSTGIPSVKGREATLQPPSWVVFNTPGSRSCVWWPARLTTLDSRSIRIDMRVHGPVARCSTGGAELFPIAVKVDPSPVDFRHPLTVRLAFTVRLPSGKVNAWERTAVAPGLG
ncbi:MAG: hypothetical protein QOG85_2274 [Gaiellaceae bacterium]|nr:hypothetical protein [Gaiellaceae bacterium]